MGVEGLTGNWPRMGRGEKAKHYVIVFLCLKDFPSCDNCTETKKIADYNPDLKISFLTLTSYSWFLDLKKGPTSCLNMIPAIFLAPCTEGRNTSL